MIAKMLYMLMVPGLVHAAASSMSVGELSSESIAAFHGMIKIRVPQSSPPVAIPSVEAVPLEVFYRNIDAGGMTLLQKDEAVKSQADLILNDPYMRQLMHTTQDGTATAALLLAFERNYVQNIEFQAGRILGLELFGRIAKSIEGGSAIVTVTPEQAREFHALQLCSAYCIEKFRRMSAEPKIFEAYIRDREQDMIAAKQMDEARDRRLERFRQAVAPGACIVRR